MHGRELPEVLSIIRTGKNNVVSLLTLRMRFNVLRQRRQASASLASSLTLLLKNRKHKRFAK